MQRTVLVAILASSLVSTLVTALAMSLAIPAAVVAQEAQLSAARLAIIGENGVERIHLSTGPGGVDNVELRSPDGATPRVNLNVGGPANLGSPLPESAGLTIFADDGSPIVRLGTSGSGPRTFEPGSQFILFDTQGRPRIIDRVDADGSPSMRFLDADGNVTWNAGGKPGPAALLRQWLEAQNRSDIPAVIALFNDDATMERAPACRPTLCVGPGEIQGEIERRLGDHNQHLILTIQEDGDTATARTDVRSDAVRGTGVERSIRIETVQARDGKISRYCYTLDVSDPDTETFARGGGPGECTTVTPFD